jgi:excisionase family DNA binding protein
MENDEWLTIEEAANYLKLSVPAIRKYIGSGRLKHYRNGRIIRLKKSDLDSFLKPIEPRNLA